MRRYLITAVLAATLLSVSSPHAMAQDIDVFKSESCGCCGLWVEHLKRHGFTPKPKNLALGQLARVKLKAGLKPEIQSCHTGMIEGYVIEGHVPAEDVKRLLIERPVAIGLSVPGMPIGSPGMEAGDRREPYDVLLVKQDGTTEVYAKH